MGSDFRTWEAASGHGKPLPDVGGGRGGRLRGAAPGVAPDGADARGGPAASGPDSPLPAVRVGGPGEGQGVRAYVSSSRILPAISRARGPAAARSRARASGERTRAAATW